MYKLLFFTETVEPFKADWGAWFKSEPFNDGFLCPLGWESELDKLDISYTEIEDVSKRMDYAEGRQLLIEQLIAAAAASPISIEFDKFYFENRRIITNWIINGGESLIELVNGASEDWWDERTTPESLTSREYAQMKLKPKPNSYFLV